MKLKTRLEQTELYDYYGAILPPKHQEILQMYYYEDCGLSEIANIYGVSRQAILYYIEKAEKRLGEMEEKLGFATKNKEIKKDISKLVSLINDSNRAKAEKIIVDILEKL